MVNRMTMTCNKPPKKWLRTCMEQPHPDSPTQWFGLFGKDPKYTRIQCLEDWNSLKSNAQYKICIKDLPYKKRNKQK